MFLFYDPFFGETHPTLNKEESHHCLHVLRHKTGDTIQVTDGKGTLYTAMITITGKQGCTVEIVAKESHTLPPHKTHIGIAPPKSMDRMEWFVEKATELGLQEITPLLCTFSERNKINSEKLEKKAISAVKQSKNLFKPSIHPFKKISDFSTGYKHDCNKFIATLNKDSSALLSSMPLPFQETIVIVGPEGGFDNREIEQAFEYGFKPVSLGNHILRTETAGITAVVMMNAASF
ncbi:MAG: 16S rRNA (uracil(1498)-N(3))-methyltransferase [Cyclobacteriaceae bacterium]|nr:16S rRNA (uracil(1498)-N(3))-methyltransferase [Cyclobacteriaceae bacterium]